VDSNNLVKQLRELGLVAQVSSEEELISHLDTGMRTVYCGFDPTADSLHVGNLVPLLALKRFQLAGHRPVLLVGGATGMIGDPGGRTQERQLNPVEVVEAYDEKIRQQAEAFLDFDCGDNSAIVVNNANWISPLGVIEFLRNIGKHFSVNAMVQKDSVRRRLEDESTGISYTEFSYMVLQAYDFVELCRHHDCTIQIGGSDQWGNITAGIDLMRRMESKQGYAVTFPLITRSDGVKMGKTAEGAVWLDPARTSPYSFYQYWRNVTDEDVIKFLRIFTLLSEEEIARLAAAHEQDPGMRQAHIGLAKAVTLLVHGEEGLASAERISEAVFANTITDLSESDMAQLANDGLPNTRVTGSEITLADALVESGLALTPRGEVTMGQARKLVSGNAVSVNGEKASDPGMVLSLDNALFGRYHLIQRGKKNHHLLVMA